MVFPLFDVNFSGLMVLYHTMLESSIQRFVRIIPVSRKIDWSRCGTCGTVLGTRFIAISGRKTVMHLEFLIKQMD
ncbi:uncharacterized protein LOC117921517 [Vitis riparia]|uniref:uncharacterized protein LOC117921517 n=1 Tax=Vitis riparia TaxID=96939 RepID=UPI00155A3A33|nr:uncharacterized protein LOC117921517 [Vitis riparia]